MTNPVGYEGEPLTLLDGTEVHVKCTMKTLMRLEDEFGSLKAVLAGLSRDGNKPMYRPSMKILAACLVHEKGRPDGRLHDAEYLADLVDPADIHDLMEKAGKAIVTAFPRAAQDAAAQVTEAQIAQAEAASASRGESGTTSAPSPSDAPPTSSGA